MKINWQENKLTIIGFGIIFIILGIFGYILWNITREPMAEISSEDTPVVTTPPIIEQQPEIVKEELPEYRITKVDTTGWESKEFKVGDVGIRYKSPTSNISLTRYGLPQKYNIFSYDANIDKSDIFSNYILEIDYLISVNPDGVNTGGGYYFNPIEISIVESNDLTLENIFNVFANNQCKYNVIESEGGMSLYEFIPQNCETQEQVTGYEYDEKFNGYEYDEKFNGPNVKATITRVEKSKRLDEVTALCLDGEKIEQFKNPFIVQNDINKATNLIKCNSILGVDDNKNIQKRERELFILSLSNNKFAIINYQNTGIPGLNGIEKDNSEKVNNLMHTILSTIEVL
jgi:hypothetical protein